jgi:hypothetical protein
MDAGVYPVRDGDDFTYTWTFTKGDVSETWGAEQQADGAVTGPDLSLAEHDGGTLRLDLYNDGQLAQQSQIYSINVTDDLTSQILEFGTLAGHYHQGDPLNLTLTVDPAPLEGDVLEWQWKWPGSPEWTVMTGVEDNVFATAAEQALDGVEIRAVLTYADPEVAPVISETRTIHVDDHGAPARQAVTVSGETDRVEGDVVSLTADVDPTTVLTRYRWERKAAGEDEFVVVDGETGPELGFEAAVGDDGAQYRATPVTPAGVVAYGPSEPVTLAVTEAPGEDPGSEEPGSEDPGSEDPGSDEPGADDPATEDPATDDPATDDPATDDPATDDPATDDPVPGTPGTEGSGGGPGGVLASTGASGVASVVGAALALTLGGALLVALRREALRRA